MMNRKKNGIRLKTNAMILVLILVSTLSAFAASSSVQHFSIRMEPKQFEIGSAAADSISEIKDWQYVANSNTGKFHRRDCRWVGEMYEEHKVFYMTRADAAADGYIACKVCKP